MKLSAECLEASQVDSLLQGNLTPEEYESAQNHLELCETCRARVEATIGPEQWWSDVQSVLRSKALLHVAASLRDAEDGPAFAASHGETRLRESVLNLLGPTDDPNMLGRIGPYEIIGLLGQGGMGAVFKGFDRSLNRFVAIKMLLPHLAASGAARKRFAREGQAVAAVVDDHVMAIHCVDEWQGVPYLVMTYSRGVSLQKRLNDNGPLEVREILRIGMQAAKGLAAAHAQGIVHRDIKPANIFLDQNVERVQLMDFGLARAVDDASLTRSGTLAGTPQYMSPEQARAETVDHRSDMFSLGSVMYAMCTGHTPFRAESSYSVLRLITDKEPRPIREINPDIPDWLCVIISKLMAKQANDRFASAQEVAKLLEDCLAHVQQPSISPLPEVLVDKPKSGFSSLNFRKIGVYAMFAIVSSFILSMLLMQPPKETKQTGAPADSAQAEDVATTDHHIAGKCIDENGKPIQDALVELYGNAGSQLSIKATRTLADGTFDLGAFPDTGRPVVVGRVEGKAIGYGVSHRNSENPIALELVLGVPGQLKGTITGPGGSPVKNARVRLAGTPWIEGVNGATSNEAGEYLLDRVPLRKHPGFGRRAIPGIPGGFENHALSGKFLIVEHAEFGVIQPTYAECPSTVDVSFDEPASVSGRVVDEQGIPVAGLSVSVRPSRNPIHREAFIRSMTSGYSFQSAKTNAAGQYSLALQYKGPVEIEFTGTSRLAKTVHDIVAEPGKIRIVPDVSAVAPGFIVGRIVDIDTENTVVCPAGVRLRVYAMGDGALTSVLVKPDGTYRLPVLPGTTFVYFSVSSASLRELSRTWDVLDHPNPLTAKDFPVDVAVEAETEVNFPVQLNKDKLGEELKSLQGNWEIRSGTYVESGNARLPLTADRLLDGDQLPLRFCIRGNQWIGNSTNFCFAPEPELALTLGTGIAELTLDGNPTPRSLTLTRIEDGRKRVSQCLYQLNGDKLELVCNATATDEGLPGSFESPENAYVLVAQRIIK